MRTIVCKFYGPTNTKGSRWKVYTDGLKPVWYPYLYEQRDGGASAVITDFAAKQGWNGGLVFGRLPDGSTVGVFTS